MFIVHLYISMTHHPAMNRRLLYESFRTIREAKVCSNQHWARRGSQMRRVKLPHTNTKQIDTYMAWGNGLSSSSLSRIVMLNDDTVVNELNIRTFNGKMLCQNNRGFQ